jgi:anti-sigma B factor antagonist
VAERRTAAAHLTWPLRVSEERHQGVLVLTLTGRIGSASAPALADRLAAATAGGDRRLVIDFAGVDYLSSAGLVVLEAANRRVEALEGALVLCALTEPVRIVLDLAGATSRFAIEPSRDLGVARLAAS